MRPLQRDIFVRRIREEIPIIISSHESTSHDRWLDKIKPFSACLIAESQHARIARIDSHDGIRVGRVGRLIRAHLRGIEALVRLDAIGIEELCLSRDRPQSDDDARVGRILLSFQRR